MKKCHVCGNEVDDREITCPECGAMVSTDTGSKFALKTGQDKKKTSNPIGMTVSTGSGLTDILKGDDDFEDDNPYEGASMPFNTHIDYDDYAPKKKPKIFGSVVKILFLAALVYGVYHLVVNVILADNGAKTYGEAIDIYVSSINEDDEDAMFTIMPPYISESQGNVLARGVLDDLDGIYDLSWTQVGFKEYNSEEKMALQDSIKLQTGKTSNVLEACLITFQLTGKTKSVGKEIPVVSRVDIELVRIRNNWYIHMDTYNNPNFE